jgi:hypothetical protein
MLGQINFCTLSPDVKLGFGSETQEISVNVYVCKFHQLQLQNIKIRIALIRSMSRPNRTRNGHVQ